MIPRLLLLFALTVGCDAAGPEDTLQQGADRTETTSTPELVASLQLASGNSVEFYDLGGRALISETGAAYTTPSIGVELTQKPLADIWSALAPGTPVPSWIPI